MFLFMQDVPEVRFVPEIVVVGTDPMTGYLIHGFELYYGIASTSETVDYQDGPLGMVSVQVLLETLPVSQKCFRVEEFILPKPIHVHI